MNEIENVHYFCCMAVVAQLIYAATANEK